MNLNDNDKDFIDKIMNFGKSYQEQGIRFVATIVLFCILFVIGLFISSGMIHFCTRALPFSVKFLQISPLEILFNYLKIAFFFAAFTIFPFFVYQFGKLQIQKDNVEEKLNLLLSSLILLLILIFSAFLTYRFIFPTEIFFLYGLNFKVAEFTASLSSMVSSFIFTLLFVLMVLLLPFMKFLIKKSLFFNYAIFIKNKKPIIIYCALLACLVALPVDAIALACIFLIFFLWYKILILFSKTRD